MTQKRSIHSISNGLPVSDGAGVKMVRYIGVPKLKNLDPFLMLDHFSSDNPDDYLKGFPDHPHRGFITITYMLEGNMEHKDSMGNQGSLGPGCVQWMKAASGVIHSEMPLQKEGKMSGFQLWLNLPASEKMSDPEYQEIKKESIPEVNSDSFELRLISGIFQENKGPITDPITDLIYIDLKLKSSNEFELDVPKGHVFFICNFSGGVAIHSEENQDLVAPGKLIRLNDGEKISLSTPHEDSHMLIIGGKAIGERIVQLGPFVMNSPDEIRQAFTDYDNNTLVKNKAKFQEK